MPISVALLLFFGSLLLGSIGAFFGLSKGEPDSIEQLAWISACAIIAQIPIVFAYAMYTKRLVLNKSGKQIALYFVIFTPLALITSGAAHFLFSIIGWENPDDLGHETLELLQNSNFSVYLLVVILVATIGAGIIEEVVFRGLLLPSVPQLIGNHSVWGAIATTSVIFAAMHIGAVPLSALLGLFVLSIGLCLARIQSGGVFVPIVVHILFNAFNIAFVL